MPVFSGQFTVTTSAVELSSNATDRLGTSVAIENTGTVTLYLGGSTVTSSTGFSLAPNVIFTTEIDPGEALYAVTDSGTTTAAVMRIGAQEYNWPVTLDEARAQLNDKNSRIDTTELQGFIDTATELVENITGPIGGTLYTEYAEGTDSIMLTHYPVLSVDSITEYSSGTAQALTEQPLGSTYDSFGFILDSDIGRLRRTSGGSPGRFPAGTRNVVVTYTAGRDAVPACARMGALELIRHLWESQRAEAASNLPSLDDEFSGSEPGPAPFAVPNRVREILAPITRAPAVG